MLPHTPPALNSHTHATDWLHLLCAPRIAVVSTDEVSVLLSTQFRINSLPRFLNPLATTTTKLNHLDLPYANLSSTPRSTSVPNYAVRFIELGDIHDFDGDRNAHALAHAVKGYANQYDQLDNVTEPYSVDHPYPTPWFDLYRYWQPQLHACVEFESVHHPAMYCFVVSTQSTDPVAALSKLNTQISTHPLFNQGWLDPGIPRYFLVLHCGGKSTDPICKTVLDSVQRSFGPNTSLLTLNNNTSTPKLAYWNKVEFDAYYLSQFRPNEPKYESQDIDVDPNTIDSVTRFIKNLVNQTLIPYMERCTAHWNETVAVPRQGITGRLFTASRKYFGSPSPPTNQIKSSQCTYSHAMSESVLRRLGDYALMLRDYKLALATYQTAARTYSADKSYKHLASAQEMVTVCQILLHQFNTVDSAHDHALATYFNKVQLPEYAARATVLACALCCAMDQPALATAMYLRMAQFDSDPMRSGLFFEQAASIQLHLRFKRKSSLYYVLAAMKFSKSALRVHAIRCLSQAQALVPKAWSALVDYVHLSLGRQYFHCGVTQRAISEMLMLIHPGQTLIMDELIFLYSQNPMAGPGLPVLWHDLDVTVPEVSILPMSPVCVHEKATAVLRMTNPLKVNLSVYALTVMVEDTVPLVEIRVSSDSNELECGPLKTKSASLSIQGIQAGVVTLKYVTYRLFDVIPIRVPLTAPRDITVIDPRPRLQVHWDVPSVVFASQVMCIPVSLSNTGFVPTDMISMQEVKEEMQDQNVILVVDSSTPIPKTVAPGDSVTIKIWSHWHASSVSVEWQYGSYTELNTVNVTLVPLVQRAVATWVFDQTSLVVKIEALHQALEGSLVGVGLASIERVDVAPRQVVTHLVSAGCGGSSCWPEWWTGPTRDLFQLLDTKVSLWLAWRLNAWSGFIPISVSPPPVLGINLLHSPSACPMKGAPLAIRVCHQGAGPGMVVKVEVSSDAYVVITGLISQTLVLLPGECKVLDRMIIPLVDGVHDIASEVHVSAQWDQVPVDELGPELVHVPIQPSYIHVAQE